MAFILLMQIKLKVKENYPKYCQKILKIKITKIKYTIGNTDRKNEKHGNRFNFFIENNKIKKQAASVRQ